MEHQFLENTMDKKLAAKSVVANRSQESSKDAVKRGSSGGAVPRRAYEGGEVPHNYKGSNRKNNVRPAGRYGYGYERKSRGRDAQQVDGESSKNEQANLDKNNDSFASSEQWSEDSYYEIYEDYQ